MAKLDCDGKFPGKRDDETGGCTCLTSMGKCLYQGFELLAPGSEAGIRKALTPNKEIDHEY